MVQSFTLTPTEADAALVVEDIKAEGYTKMEAAVLALPAIPNPDAEFVEYLTCGALSLDATGSMTGDPSVMAWLQGVRERGTAW
jgi:hypothetical protein